MLSTTQSNHAATTGPAASAALAAPVGLTPGRYAIDVYASLSGTVTAAEADNVQLLVDGTQTDVVIVAPVANGPAVKQSFEHLTATGAIALEAVANAGGSAIYHTLLVVALLPHYDAA